MRYYIATDKAFTVELTDDQVKEIRSQGVVVIESNAFREAWLSAMKAIGNLAEACREAFNMPMEEEEEKNGKTI